MLTDHFSQSGVQPPPPAAKTCFTHTDRRTCRLMVITLSVWYTALRATTRLTGGPTVVVVSRHSVNCNCSVFAGVVWRRLHGLRDERRKCVRFRVRLRRLSGLRQPGRRRGVLLSTLIPRHFCQNTYTSMQDGQEEFISVMQASIVKWHSRVAYRCAHRCWWRRSRTVRSHRWRVATRTLWR